MQVDHEIGWTFDPWCFEWKQISPSKKSQFTLRLPSTFHRPHDGYPCGPICMINSSRGVETLPGSCEAENNLWLSPTQKINRQPRSFESNLQTFLHTHTYFSTVAQLYTPVNWLWRPKMEAQSTSLPRALRGIRYHDSESQHMQHTMLQLSALKRSSGVMMENPVLKRLLCNYATCS